MEKIFIKLLKKIIDKAKFVFSFLVSIFSVIRFLQNLNFRLMEFFKIEK